MTINTSNHGNTPPHRSFFPSLYRVQPPTPASSVHLGGVSIPYFSLSPRVQLPHATPEKADEGLLTSYGQALRLGLPLHIQTTSALAPRVRSQCIQMAQHAGMRVKELHCADPAKREQLLDVCIQAYLARLAHHFDPTVYEERLKEARLELSQLQEGRTPLKEQDAPSPVTDDALIRRVTKEATDISNTRRQLVQEQRHPHRKECLMFHDFHVLSEAEQRDLLFYCGLDVELDGEHLQLFRPRPMGVILEQGRTRQVPWRVLGHSMGVQIDELSPTAQGTMTTGMSSGFSPLTSMEDMKAYPALQWLVDYVDFGLHRSPGHYRIALGIMRYVQSFFDAKIHTTGESVLALCKDAEISLLPPFLPESELGLEEKIFDNVLRLMGDHQKKWRTHMSAHYATLSRKIGRQLPNQPHLLTEEDAADLQKLWGVVGPAYSFRHRLAKVAGYSIDVQAPHPLEQVLRDLRSTTNTMVLGRFIQGMEGEIYDEVRAELLTRDFPAFVVSMMGANTTLAEQLQQILLGKIEAEQKAYSHVERRHDWREEESLDKEAQQERAHMLPAYFEYIAMTLVQMAGHPASANAALRDTMLGYFHQLKEDNAPLRLLHHGDGVIYTKDNLSVNHVFKGAHYLRRVVESLPLLARGKYAVVAPRFDVFQHFVKPELDALRTYGNLDEGEWYILRHFVQAQVDMLSLYFYSLQGDISEEAAAQRARYAAGAVTQAEDEAWVHPVISLIDTQRAMAEFDAPLPMHFSALLREHVYRGMEALLILSEHGLETQEARERREQFRLKHRHAPEILGYLPS